MSSMYGHIWYCKNALMLVKARWMYGAKFRGILIHLHATKSYFFSNAYSLDLMFNVKIFILLNDVDRLFITFKYGMFRNTLRINKNIIGYHGMLIWYFLMNIPHFRLTKRSFRKHNNTIIFLLIDLMLDGFRVDETNSFNFLPIKWPFDVHIRTVQSTDDVSKILYSSEISKL